MAYRLHGNRTQGLRSMQLVLEMIDTYQALARRPNPNPNPVIDALTPEPCDRRSNPIPDPDPNPEPEPEPEPTPNQAQPNALLCADEVFCGRAPHRGTETCAVVEAMASLEQARVRLGVGVWG